MPDDDEGTVVEAAGVVKTVDDGRATIDVTVTNAGQKVLGVCRAVVRCSDADVASGWRDWTTLAARRAGAALCRGAPRATSCTTPSPLPMRRGEPVLVLGGGSNLVVADEGFAGHVVRVATAGPRRRAAAPAPAPRSRSRRARTGTRSVVDAVAQDWIGIEALSGIPGTVGAVPIQNVGAYGQEVAETIAQVHTYDRLERRTRIMFAADCGFGYRTSVFKRTRAGTSSAR